MALVHVQNYTICRPYSSTENTRRNTRGGLNSELFRNVFGIDTHEHRMLLAYKDQLSIVIKNRIWITLLVGDVNIGVGIVDSNPGFG